MRNSDVQTAQTDVSDTAGIRDMSREPWSLGSDMEIHPENSREVCRELQNPPRINEMSRGQVSVMPSCLGTGGRRDKGHGVCSSS